MAVETIGVRIEPLLRAVNSLLKCYLHRFWSIDGEGQLLPTKLDPSDVSILEIGLKINDGEQMLLLISGQFMMNTRGDISFYYFLKPSSGQSLGGGATVPRL